jgi:predicted transposase/invertase (TIGR01784 family)
MKEGMKKGIEKGMKKGIEKGTHDNAIEMARKMLDRKFSLDEISDITGLSQEEIQRITD